MLRELAVSIHSHALCVANLYLIEFAPEAEVYETKYSVEIYSLINLQRIPELLNTWAGQDDVISVHNVDILATSLLSGRSAAQLISQNVKNNFITI